MFFKQLNETKHWHIYDYCAKIMKMCHQNQRNVRKMKEKFGNMSGKRKKGFHRN